MHGFYFRDLRSGMLTLLLAASVSLATAAPYAITDLGTLPGFANSVACGINGFGQVSGSTFVGGVDHGFLWTPSTANANTGSMTDLGAADDCRAGALKLNDYGQVTFNAGLPGVGGLVAFLWTPTAPNGRAGAALPIVSTSFPSSIFGINSVGQVVGRMYPGTAFVWTPDARNGTTGATNHSLVDGRDYPGYQNGGVATAINDAGQVAGSGAFGSYGFPFIHNDGRVSFPAQNPYDFGPVSSSDVIGPFQANSQEGAGGVAAINAAGHTAGSRVFANAQGQLCELPAYWDGSQFRGIGSACGYSANGINNHDDVVGQTVLANANGAFGHFLYSRGALTELRTLVDPSLGWDLKNAWAINDAGQIVGEGYHNGVYTAFLMNPLAADVSSQIVFTPGGRRCWAATRQCFQTVTLTNNGATTVSQVSLVLSGLGPNIALANRTGTTTAVTPAGRPYIDVGSIGASISVGVGLVFDDPSLAPITYSTQVLAGAGAR
jgi:uncharacterized membrane protein